MVQGLAGRYSTHTTGHPSVEASGGDKDSNQTTETSQMCSVGRVHRITCQLTAHTRNKLEPHTSLLSRQHQTTMANINTRHDDLLILGRTKEELKCKLPGVLYSEPSQIIGVMTSFKSANSPNRGLQELRNNSLNLHHSYDAMVQVDQRTKKDLERWINQSHHWNFKPILPRQPSPILESDASNQGWGATRWNPRDSTRGV